MSLKGVVAPWRLATSETGSLSASCKIRTICSSANLDLFITAPLLREAIVSNSSWSENVRTGKISGDCGLNSTRHNIRGRARTYGSIARASASDALLQIKKRRPRRLERRLDGGEVYLLTELTHAINNVAPPVVLIDEVLRSTRPVSFTTMSAPLTKLEPALMSSTM